jgi:hypothetical protein
MRVFGATLAVLCIVLVAHASYAQITRLPSGDKGLTVGAAFTGVEHKGIASVRLGGITGSRTDIVASYYRFGGSSYSKGSLLKGQVQFLLIRNESGHEPFLPAIHAGVQGGSGNTEYAWTCANYYYCGISFCVNLPLSAKIRLQPMIAGSYASAMDNENPDMGIVDVNMAVCIEPLERFNVVLSRQMSASSEGDTSAGIAIDFIINTSGGR